MVNLRYFVLCLFLCATLPAPVHAVIYGTDDRKEYYEGSVEEQVAAGSVGLMVHPSDIVIIDPYDVQLQSGIYGEDQGLCLDEPFWDQPTSGWCSGTLIDDDLFLTAGHCIDSSSCATTSIVFNYWMVDVGTQETITVDDIFGCEEIVVRKANWIEDYAVVRLDRDATPRFSPAPVRWGGLFEYSPHGSNVVGIGHPYGMPTKIADNAVVMDSHLEYFSANIDHFGGNSGSGVFNSPGELVGILVRGVTDFDYDSDGDCYVSRICDEGLGCDPALGDPFPTMTRTSSFAEYVPHDPFCGNGLCEPPDENESSCPEDCPQDSDYDFSPDLIDNCPWLPNTAQENLDGDSLGDACDCDSGDPGCWAEPTEIGNLGLIHDQPTGWTVLTWDPPLQFGATSVVYDTLRSEFPFDFRGATCVESDDGLDLLSEDGDFLLEGMVYYYLVRAQNICPDGEGPLGGDWRDKPREGRSCPF